MQPSQAPVLGPPRIEGLVVRNYRVLRNVEFKGLSPLTVLVGPNGSGKSTVFDVFAFLSECFTEGLRSAVDKRNRLAELRSRGADGPVVIEIKYRETPQSPLITYHLAIDEIDGSPVVAEEWLRWKRGSYGRPFKFVDFAHGAGQVISGDMPDEHDERIFETLDSPDLLAVNTLGQFTRHPRVSALRRFITGWYLSYLSAEEARGVPMAGPQSRLSKTGDNLPNVLQFLAERHEVALENILATLSVRIPRLERVDTKALDDGRLLLLLKDAPFEEPVLARFASDGTLKMLSYLVVLLDPDPPPMIGIEEPENQLHPQLLFALAEECRAATGRSQLLVTTHSPEFMNGLRAHEVWALDRGEDGFTQLTHADKNKEMTTMVDAGGQLGDLWMEGFLHAGDLQDSLRGVRS